MSLVLVILLIICFFEWILTRISLIAIIWYLNEKNLPFPSDKEIKEGSKYAIKNLFLKRR